MFENDPFEQFLDEARQLPLLSRSEEAQRLADARAGDEAARQAVIKSYLGLVALLAVRLADPQWRRVDAVQEALVVLAAVVDDEPVTQPALVLAERIKQHVDEVERRLRGA